MKLLFFCAAIGLPATLAGQGNFGLIPSLQSYAVSDLVVTEIMADPDPPGGLPPQEYCEILNRSSIPVNLAGWIFYDGSARTLPPVTIDPGEYLIICDDADTALFSIYGKCAAISSISITNTGEKIALRDPQGNPVDSVNFSDSWYGNTFKKDGGWSLEKVDADFTCPVSSNWLPSINTSGGSPGVINSVAGIIQDEEEPILLRSYCIDSTSLMLVFTEALDPSSALSLQNYSTSDAAPPVSVVFEDELLQRVKLTLSGAIISGVTGTVSVSGISDCAGNEIGNGSMVQFGTDDSVSYKKLVINEVLFNPEEEGYDFIELFHSGYGIVDLSKIKIESYDTETGQPEETEPLSDEPWLLFPGEYIVLTEMPASVSMQYRSPFPFNFIEIGNMPSMNVDEGHVAITANGEKIDDIHYNEKYHFALLEDLKGISLEKINPGFQSTDPASWHSAAESAGFATPGSINSQFREVAPGNNHISLAPEIFSPGNDGIDDVVTITIKTGTPGYISNVWIYNADGKVVFQHAMNTLLATNDAFIWDGITDKKVQAPAGIYIALVEVFNLEGVVKQSRIPFVLAIKL